MIGVLLSLCSCDYISFCNLLSSCIESVPFETIELQSKVRDRTAFLVTLAVCVCVCVFACVCVFFCAWSWPQVESRINANYTE